MAVYRVNTTGRVQCILQFVNLRVEPLFHAGDHFAYAFVTKRRVVRFSCSITCGESCEFNTKHYQTCVDLCVRACVQANQYMCDEMSTRQTYNKCAIAAEQ